MLENGLLMRKEECFFNSRVKCYLDENGNRVPYEIMSCSRKIFSGGGLELSRRQAPQEPDEVEAGDIILSSASDASRRRARRKIFDYCICNDFTHFVTLTLDKSQIDRNDYGAAIRKLNAFLGNRVRRKGLKYIGVPEYHLNGGLHFHFLVGSSVPSKPLQFNTKFPFFDLPLKLVDSGTVTVEGCKRPIKVSTADRRGVPLDKRHTVYNVADWTIGFSTAIELYGSRGAVATYMAKELCKSCQKRLADDGNIDKIGGRWYLHGGDLKSPVCLYQNVDFDAVEKYSYEVATDGGDFKVIKLDEHGEVLR